MTRQQQLKALLRHVEEGVDMAASSASKINLLTGLSVFRHEIQPRRMRETAAMFRIYADSLEEKAEEMVS